MSRLDIGALNEYSRKFAELLFASHPEWMELAESITDPATQQIYLQLEIPSPKEANLAYDLYILTIDEEITIGFDHTHWHVWMSLSEDLLDFQELAEFQLAVEDIDNVIAEEKVALSAWRGGELLGSQFCSPSALPNQSAELLESFIHDRKLASRTEVRIRSWRGSWNTDFCVV